MKRVLLLSDASLFGLGVQNILSREVDLEIVGSESEIGRAAQRVKELQPDVVIMDRDRWPVELPVELLGVLEEAAPITIIGLSLQDNTICSYRREQRVIKRVEDLMEAIK